MIVNIPDWRISVELSPAGELLAVRPLTGLDTVERHHVRQIAKMIAPPAGCEMVKDGQLDWRAYRICNCVIETQHCPACDAAARKAY